jgi:hypothetical protein
VCAQSSLVFRLSELTAIYLIHRLPAYYKHFPLLSISSISVDAMVHAMATVSMLQEVALILQNTTQYQS